MTLRERAALSEQAARAAGEMLLAHPHTPARHKAENDYVTEFDVKSEELIRSILLTACPEDGFYGEEEGGSEQAASRWIVDPIDGTSNFYKGEKLYTISIAYEENGELTIGCVFCPPTNELFLGVKGEGATLNGNPIHVSEESVTRNAYLHMAFCHRSQENNARVIRLLPEICHSFSDLRRTGSAAYDLCSVADGRCEGFFELGLHLYDIAAGTVILREAGGLLTAWNDAENPLDTGNVLATNGRIHAKLKELLNK